MLEVGSSPEPLYLILRERKQHLKKRLTCQNNKENMKLSSTEAGTNIITGHQKL